MLLAALLFYLMFWLQKYDDAAVYRHYFKLPSLFHCWSRQWTSVVTKGVQWNRFSERMLRKLQTVSSHIRRSSNSRAGLRCPATAFLDSACLMNVDSQRLHRKWAVRKQRIMCVEADLTGFVAGSTAVADNGGMPENSALLSYHRRGPYPRPTYRYVLLSCFLLPMEKQNIGSAVQRPCCVFDHFSASWRPWKQNILGGHSLPLSTSPLPKSFAPSLPRHLHALLRLHRSSQCVSYKCDMRDVTVIVLFLDPFVRFVTLTSQ